ncbi:hypothetical protein FGO68_gene6572 [Halteria grandinella]|uniref:Uncharacterized protein n=1 Tax=Halteria grandinella TaxID=5974 RepID=A0A8J8T964_HALGN|nr:hypothetical protein FGO68_gene6572 [Halteria grandinella]
MNVKQQSASAQKHSQRMDSKQKHLQPPPKTIKELPPDYEDDIRDFDNKANPRKQDEDDDDDGMSDDDQINENLFNRYDQMFVSYNQFGAMFQETAHYIGLLIKKNMMLNKELEEQFDKHDSLIEKLKESEKAYENLLSGIAEKDRLIEILTGENASLRLEIQQQMTQQQQQQPQTVQQKLNFNQPKVQKEEAKRELPKSLVKEEKKNKEVKPQKQALIQIIPPQQSKPQPKIQQVIVESESPREFKPYKNGGTFETFYEIDKSLTVPDESCSLKDLFSQKHTKKRNLHDFIEDSPSVLDVPKDESKEEKKEEQWITNKKRRSDQSNFKRKCEEDSQMADRFQNMSQAFLFNNPSNHNQPSFSNQFGNSGGKKLPLQSKLIFNQALKEDRDSIGHEDSAQSSVMSQIFNVAIKFDARKEEIKQQIKEQEAKKLAKANSGGKKFDIQIVEQVSESFQEDFFKVKNEKKNKKSGLAGGLSVAAITHDREQSNGKPKK